MVLVALMYWMLKHTEQTLNVFLLSGYSVHWVFYSSTLNLTEIY